MNKELIEKAAVVLLIDCLVSNKEEWEENTGFMYIIVSSLILAVSMHI